MPEFLLVTLVAQTYSLLKQFNLNMYIKVTVQPGAKEDSIVKVTNDTFKLKVKAKAERNQANLAVIGLVSAYFDLPRGKVKIVTGHHHPKKILSLGD